MPERNSSLGTWIKRFLMEYLPTERNLAINTLKSYRDGLTLLLPFVAERCSKAVRAPRGRGFVRRACVTAFLGHLGTRTGLLGADSQTCALRRSGPSPATSRCATRHLLNGPAASAPFRSRKRCDPRSPGCRRRNMDAMIAGPDRRTVAGRVEHALLLFLYNTGARASEATGLQVEDMHLPERTGENARATIHGKGGKIRITPLWTSTAKALGALSRDRPLGCESVFWSRHRKPYTRHGIIELVERAAARVPETPRAKDYSACTSAQLRLSPASLRRRYQHHSCLARSRIARNHQHLRRGRSQSEGRGDEIHLPRRCRRRTAMESRRRPALNQLKAI